MCYFDHLAFSSCNQGDWKMCLTKIELSKITYSFQTLFKLEQKILLVCVFLPFFLWMTPSSRWGLLVYYTRKWERPQGEEHGDSVVTGYHLIAGKKMTKWDNKKISIICTVSFWSVSTIGWNIFQRSILVFISQFFTRYIRYSIRIKEISKTYLVKIVVYENRMLLQKGFCPNV